MQNGFGLLISVAALVLIVIAGFMLFGNTTNDGEPAQGEGRVYFSITDAAANMEAVSEVRLEIDSIELYSEVKGWTRASVQNDNFALLELRDSGTLKLAGQVNAAADTYNQVRLKLDSVTVEETSGEAKQATLTSNQLTFDVNVDVREQEDSHVTIDVLADKSLHTSEEGEYVFAPTVLIESRAGATVSVDSSQNVSVSGGSVTANTTFGSDLNGEVKANFELPADTQINLDIFGGVEGSASSDDSSSSNAGASGSASGSVNTGNGSADVDASLEGNVETNL